MLAVSYHLLDHGWARVTLSSGEAALALSVSYITDALDELVEAVIKLLLGMEEASLRWRTEPGEYRVQFQARGDTVSVQVLERRTPVRWADVLSAEGSLLHLGIQVRSALRQLRQTHGLEGYKTSWGREFPIEHQRRLEALIRQEKRRDQRVPAAPSPD
jgi:hypothetical protein